MSSLFFHPHPYTPLSLGKGTGVRAREVSMLRIQNVSKTYPSGTQALKNVSFDVNDGEFLVVIGLSGSGKSTLLRCINRLIDPTEGRIFLDDVDVTAAPPAELRQIRRKIGMVFQQFNLVKRSSVMTNVLSGRLGYVNPWMSLIGLWPQEDKQRALHALERVGIADKAGERADASPADSSNGSGSPAP